MHLLGTGRVDSCQRQWKLVCTESTCSSNANKTARVYYSPHVVAEAAYDPRQPLLLVAQPWRRSEPHRQTADRGECSQDPSCRCDHCEAAM